MQKNRNVFKLDKEYFNKVKRIMKLSTILLFAVVITMSAASAYPQIARLTLNLEDVNIQGVIDAVESQSQYIFLLKDDVLKSNKKVTIKIENETLDNILVPISESLDFNYIINERQVIIYQKAQRQSSKEIIQTQNRNLRVLIERGEVYGVVSEAETGKALPFAQIVIKGTTIGTISDAEGSYVLSGIPAGNQIIVFYFLGYEKLEKPVTIIADSKIRVNISLKTMSILASEVVITKQAKGQMKAINKQLNSNEIMNVVSAERIQEMPDANAAETVSRLPGVSLQREGGEGSKLVIRGLAPKYNKISIEGVSMPSTGGEDRSVDVSMISPYSLDGIEVVKAITADKDADYMGGSVNFKLRKAEAGFKSSIIVQGGYNNLKNTYSDFMIVANAGNRFLSDKLGVYVQGNIEDRNRSSNELFAYIGHYRTPVLDENNVLTTGGLSLIDNIRHRNRYGATLVLDYKLPQGSIQFNNILSQSITSTQVFTEMYTSGRTHEYQTGDNLNNLLIMTNVLDYTQRFGKFEVFGKVSHSLSYNKTPQALSFHYVQGDGMSSDVFAQPLAPEDILDYATLNDSIAYLTAINNGYGLSEQVHLEGEFNLKYNFVLTDKITGNIKSGFKYRQIANNYDYDVHSGVMNLGSGTTQKNAVLEAFPWMQEIAPLGSAHLPYLMFEDKGAIADEFLGGRYTLGPRGDIDLMHDVLTVIKESTVSQTGISETYHYNDFLSNTYDYQGTEYLSAAYLMSELNIGNKLVFIPGVRFEKNMTSYNALRGKSSLPFPDTKYVRTDTLMNHSDQFILPMIHLKYSPFKWFNVRLAYTATLSRPSFNVIIPRYDIGTTIVSWNNFALKPEFSRNYDVYFSFRQNKLGLFTIGGFSKDIENKIFPMDKRVILDASEYNLPESVEGKYIYTQINNENNAKVRGVEIDWQTSFWYLPGALKGIVLNVNYTTIFSEAKYPRTVIESEWDPNTFSYTFKNIDDYYTAPLVFQPKDIVNFSVGYDYKDFFARISMLYQAKVFQGPSFWPELVNYSDDYVRWDLSVKQELPWYGIQVFCNLNNLTNAKDVLLNRGSGYTSSMQHYGRTVDIGLRINMDYKKTSP